MEEYPLSENMNKFFDNLFEIKEFVLNKYNETKNEDFKEIYDKLHKIIKTKEEDQ